VVIDSRGQIIGMIGRELRSATTDAWLNYALPVDAFRESLAAILDGRFVAQAVEDESLPRPEEPWSLEALGIVLVPDVLANTPPFVDALRPGTPAGSADIRPDDLMVLIDGQLTPSCRAVRDTLALADKFEPLKLTLLRSGELVEVTLEAIRP
jgi:serine protease Do